MEENEKVPQVTGEKSGQISTKENPSIVDSKVEETVNRYEEIRKELADSKKDFITIFGIFASFVVFLSIEIQVFKTVSEFWLLMGLSSFILASVLLFALATQQVAKSNLNSRDFLNPVTILIAVFLFFSFLFFWMNTLEEKSSSASYNVILSADK